MKKFLVSLLAIFVVCMTVNVKAMSESDLLAKFKASYEINGATFQLSESDKVLVQRYFDQNEISASDADYIAGKIDEAISAMKNSGVSDFSDFSKLPSSLKNKLKQLVQDVASNTSVNATVSKGSIVIYNTDGSVFAEVSKLVKNTGYSVDVVSVVALFVTILGTVLVIKNIKSHA